MALEASEIMLLESIQRDAREANVAATECKTSIATLDARTLDHTREIITLQDKVAEVRDRSDDQIAEIRKEARSASTMVGVPIAGAGFLITLFKDAFGGGS